jgi:hypothetical protein
LYGFTLAIECGDHFLRIDSLVIGLAHDGRAFVTQASWDRDGCGSRSVQVTRHGFPLVRSPDNRDPTGSPTHGDRHR